MWIYFYLLVLVWFKQSTGETAILDSRCYLEGGGSAESFLASEDLPIGSVIGTLRINGDPNKTSGTIALSLRERDPPVAIAPGTKNIILVQPLDKEGVKGPSSVYVNVICDRKHSSDPSFVVPVNIRVTDANDNAPQWIGSPYLLTLSEVTVPGTRILQGARAVDHDQQGPFSTVEYQVLPGPYSSYVNFVSPLEGTLVLRKALDYEMLKNFTVTLRAQDQGTPPRFSDTSLRVQVTDADDQNPKFLQESYFAELPDDGKPGELKILPEPIRAVDQDEGIGAPIQYSIMPSSESRHFSINPKTGAINLVSVLGSIDLPIIVTLVIKATQVDNQDRYALSTLAISRRDVKLAPGQNFTFIQPMFRARVREDMGIGSRILALPISPPGRNLRYFISDAEQSNYFAIGALGEIVLQRPLDYEKSTSHNFQVVASDGKNNATTSVEIEVGDVNDWEPRFRQTHYEFSLPEGKAGQPVAIGKLEAADGDRNDKVIINLRGGYSNLFEIDANGMLWLKGGKPNVSVMHLIATATDSGTPQRSATVPITISTNEISALTQSGWAPGILTAFAVVLGLFLIVILLLSFYIYKSRSPKGRNRIHSQANSTASGANIVEKLESGNSIRNDNIILGHPIHAHGGSGSSISVAASTILDRDGREREPDSYAATVRNIISRCAARGATFYDDNERDSLSTVDRQAWTTSANNNNGRGKKLTWDNDNGLDNGKTEIMRSVDTLGSTENNLTVYF